MFLGLGRTARARPTTAPVAIEEQFSTLHKNKTNYDALFFPDNDIDQK
jgi:hypothetical protein